jgi:basic membrane protein A
MIMAKRALSVIFILLFVLSFACGKKEDGEKEFLVILVTDAAGLGDKGFNDAGWSGVKRAEKELKIKGSFIQSYEQADYIPNLSLAARKGEVVVAMGYLMIDAVYKVAADFPDTPFIFIDGKIERDNVASYDFKSEQGAFLSGIIAAYTTESGVIGVVTGMDIPPVIAYETGFRAGVASGGEKRGRKLKVITVTAGDFNNPAKGKALAKSLIAGGADVIFQLAGNTGLGVIEAVKEEQVLAIGVDIDQDALVPGRILTSVLKRIDTAVYNGIKEAQEGRFQGGHYFIGLKDNAISLTEMRYTRESIPAEALELVRIAEEDIKSGRLIIPRTRQELRRFTPPRW